MTYPATILLVEDDRPLLDGIAELLEVSDIGYSLQVVKTTDGQEGLAAVENFHPDLIISDIMMPNMGGFEFLEQLRSQQPWVHIPVIFLTARGTRDDVLKGRLSGAELYLTKPYDSDELLQLVRSQLDRSLQLRGARRQQLNKLSRNIVKLLNHEFRTPLTYVTAYYELLADGIMKENSESLREYLRGIQIGAGRLSQLVSNLVKIMALRTGAAAKEIYQHSELIEDLNRLLAGVCGPRIWHEGQRTVYIRCHIAHYLPPIYGHRDSLYTMLECLIDNAIKFTLKKENVEPQIVVSGKAQGNEVWISVSDNGIGLPPDASEKVFDLFYQYNREELEQQGAGTGLTIVRGLAKLHSGRVDIKSVPGRGSIFSIVLPVRLSNLERPTHLTVEKKKATILLVEDEWYLLEGLRDLLGIFDSSYDLKILTASDGREGLQVLQETEPDLIITDIMMPNMDGYEFLLELRKNPAWLHIPVIFLTAKGDRRDIIRGRTSGAEEYITKPYNVSELFSVITAQLDRYYQRQQAVEQDFQDLKRNILELLMTDINMPLGLVAEYSDRMAASLEKLQSDEDLSEYLKAIESGSKEVTRLIADFILLVEMRTGQATDWYSRQAQPMDMSAMVLHLTSSGFTDYDMSKAIFRLDLAEDSGPVLLDANLFGQSVKRLVNLIVILCQACNQVDILISTSRSQDDVVLTISTAAVGLTTDEVDDVNSLLSQPEAFVPELSKYDPALLLAKGVVHYHGGHIKLAINDANGLAITIRLPLYKVARKVLT